MHLLMLMMTTIRTMIPERSQAPLEALKDLGWTLAYDQSVVPASCRGPQKQLDAMS